MAKRERLADFRVINQATIMGLSDVLDNEITNLLREYDKEVIVTCRVFTNKDGSTGRLYLICSDVSLSGEHIDNHNLSKEMESGRVL